MRVAIDAARPTSRERPARLFLMASMRDGDQGGLAAPAPPAAALVAAVQVLPPWLWLVVEPGRAMLPAGPWPDLAAAWQLAGNCNVGLRGVTPWNYCALAARSRPARSAGCCEPTASSPLRLYSFSGKTFQRSHVSLLKAPTDAADEPLSDTGCSGDREGAVPEERADVVAPVVIEALAGVSDDLQVPGTAAGGAEVALDQCDRIVDVTGSEGGRPVPREGGVVVVAPEVGQPAAGQRDHNLEVAPAAKAALDEGWGRRGAGGAGDREGAVPREGADVVAPVVVQPVAGMGDDLQVPGTAAGGAEVALDERHRIVVVAGPKQRRPTPGQVGSVGVAREVGQLTRQPRGDDFEVALGAEVSLDERWALYSIGAGDGEGAVPREGVEVVAPVVVQPVAGAGDDLQVPRACAGGAEVALDECHRMVVVV